MRLMRGSVIDTLNQDWVRTAYSKGLSRGRVIPVHVLRNSLIPVITNSATNFGVLLVGATVTEGIFNVPGVGNTLFQARIRRRGADSGLLRDRVRHPLRPGQPARRPALRSARPEDPLCHDPRLQNHYVAPVETERSPSMLSGSRRSPGICGGTPGAICVVARCSGSRWCSRSSSS
jgi:hypothetical protein